MNKIIINTDGGARGNPGPAGAGFVIKDGQGKILRKDSKFLGKQTNNWAEYEAVILALKEAKRLLGKELQKTNVKLYLDSELVQRQLSGEYQIKEKSLFPQFIKVWNMRVKDFPNIEFIHIERAKNVEADSLANIAMDKGNMNLLDEK